MNQKLFFKNILRGIYIKYSIWSFLFFIAIIIYIFLFFTSCYSSNEQEKKVVLKTERKFLDEDSSNMNLCDFNFISIKETYNDSSFSESGLLCSDDTASVCKLTFKVIKDYWYILADSSWQEFYNPLDSLIKVVYFRKEKFILKPTAETIVYNNEILLGFEKEELYVNSSERNLLFFNSKYGVVAVGRVNDLIVRKDFMELTRNKKSKK